MSTIKIGRESIVVDLEWVGLSVQTDLAKQKKEVCQASGHNVGYSVTDNTGVVIIGLPSGRIKKGQISGAATVAAANKEGGLVLLEPLDSSGSEYWVCAVKNGAPVNGYDTVCSRERARQLLIDARDGVFDEFSFHCTSDEFDDIVRDRLETSYAELTFGAKPVKAIYLVGLDPIYIWLVAAVMLAGAGSMLANRFYAEYQARIAQEREQLAALQAKEADKRLAIEAARKQSADLAAEVSRVVIEKPSIAQYMKSIWGELKGLPSAISGWSLTGVECGPVDCTVSWKREKYGTAVDFLVEAEKRDWRIYSVSPSTIVTQFSFSAPKRAADLSSLKPSTPFLMAMSDAATRFGLVGGQAQLPTFVGLKRPDTTVDVEWAVGVLSLSGVTLHSLLAVPEYFESRGLAVRKVQLSPKGDWKMDIDAAAKAS